MNTETNPDDSSKSVTSMVIDIYDSNKRLLELDIYTRDYFGIKAGEYLYQNGQEVNGNNKLDQYDSKKAELFNG